MGEVLVVNASPTIVLAKIGHLDLFARLADRVLVPRAVVAEVLGPRHVPATAAISAPKSSKSPTL